VTHLTAVGHVVVRRRVWHRPDGGVGVPADEWLNGQAARISVGARERCCRVGCQPHGFRRAAEDLQHLAGISVSPEHLRQVVESEGQHVAKRRQTGALGPTWRGTDCGTVAGPTRVYVGIDGFMAPMVTEAEKQKRRAARAQRRRGGRRRVRPRLRRGHRERYKEFKLTAFYDQPKQHRHVLATASGPETVGRGLRRAARQLELRAVDEVVGIVDGAPWIRGQLKRLAGCDHIGLDFYHFSEHVAAAARACFGEGTEKSAAWRHAVVHLALAQDVDAVLDEVTRQRAALRSRTKRAALAQLRNYVGERTSMIRYAESRARGWDIGSGPTESLCKGLARRRKGPGMRWDPAGADAILALTTLQQSNAWEDYWKSTVQQN
jgi:hypothetical protein